MTWVAKMEKPNTILIEAAWLDVNEQADVASILCSQRNFFSTHYFNTIKEVLKTTTTCKCIVNTLDNFFDFI